MDKEYYDSLVQVRLDRARELLTDAVALLEKVLINQLIIGHFML